MRCLSIHTERLQSFKKTRKNKKDDKLSKRRATATEAIGVKQTTHANSTIAQTGQKVYGPTDLPTLKEIISKSASPNDEALIDSVRAVRRMLSVEKNPPVLAVIKSGLLPYFSKFLLCTENPGLQFEAAWALTNVASTQHTDYVVEAGAVDPLVMCLRSADPNVREQAGWCIGNIAGDSAELRDKVLAAGVIEPLLLNVQNPDNQSLLSNIVWTISNLMRGKPQPELSAVAPAIPALAFLLNSKDPNITDEILVDVCWALSYLTDGENNRIQAVIDTNTTSRLVELLEKGSTSLKTPIVRILRNYVSGEDHQTQAVIDAGVLDKIRPLLDSPRVSNYFVSLN